MTTAYLSGMSYGSRMTFRRYLLMLRAFTDGRIPLRSETGCRAFIAGAYVGFLRINPGCAIR